ncbi:MAG: hypothetical protein V1722_04580 [Candidatus Micrarchaeota archaeon]
MERRIEETTIESLARANEAAEQLSRRLRRPANNMGRTNISLSERQVTLCGKRLTADQKRTMLEQVAHVAELHNLMATIVHHNSTKITAIFAPKRKTARGDA